MKRSLPRIGQPIASVSASQRSENSARVGECGSGRGGDVADRGAMDLEEVGDLGDGATGREHGGHFGPLLRQVRSLLPSREYT